MNFNKNIGIKSTDELAADWGISKWYQQRMRNACGIREKGHGDHDHWCLKRWGHNTPHICYHCKENF